MHFDPSSTNAFFTVNATNNEEPISSVFSYGYSFDYKGQYSIVNLQGETVDMGVAHGDDLQYVFAGLWGSELTMSASDNKFISNVWTPLLTRYIFT